MEVTSLFLVLTSLLAIFRFRQIESRYHPFILLIWLGTVAEILFLIHESLGKKSTPNTNIYVLLESILILWLFRRWNFFGRRPSLHFILGGFFALIWIIEILLISPMQYCSYFIIITSLVIVLMSVSHMNKIIISEKGNLLKNPEFIIATGFVLFFTFALLVEIFWVYGLNASKSFRTNVYSILTYVNLTVNIIYTVAILWMRRKQGYIRLSL